MTTTALEATGFEVEDVEYLRHGEAPLLARIFTPRGAGPFPALVACHGGAWCLLDRLTDAWWHQHLAAHGVVTIALDFRSGAAAPYPASLQDINYAVRWAKLHAAELKTRPELIGLDGRSTGGHQAMLTAMRPNDPRYAAIALPAGAAAQDASVACVVMTAPVINPLSRYRYAKRLAAAGAAWAPNIIRMHDSFWPSEAAMAEGNPVLALERGEPVVTPPTLWLQSRDDFMHDYKDEESDFPGNEPQRFVAGYRQAGGQIDLEYLDVKLGPGVAPEPAQIAQMYARVAKFLGERLAVG